MEKRIKDSYSKKIFSLLLCLCMVFSQMGFGFAEETIDHTKHYHYNASTGMCDGACIEGINIADYAEELDGLNTKLGEKNKYYYIDSAVGWKTFAEYINQEANASTSTSMTPQKNFSGCTVWLTSNIDLSSWENQVPVGKLETFTTSVKSSNAELKIDKIGANFFGGTFDGNNYSISGVDINQSNGKATGLFAFSYGGEFKNLTVDGQINVSEASNAENAGGIGGVVGLAYDTDEAFDNLTNRIDIKSENSGTGDAVGGICGSYLGAQVTFSNCKNEGELEGKSQVGGIIGYARLNGVMTIKKCCNGGKLTTDGSTTYVAGILGKYSGKYTASKTNYKQNFTVEYCYNNGTMTGSNKAGLVGDLEYAKQLSISASFSAVNGVAPVKCVTSGTTNAVDQSTVFYLNGTDTTGTYGTGTTNLATMKNVWAMNQKGAGENIFALSVADEDKQITFADANSPTISQVKLTAYKAGTAVTMDSVSSVEEDGTFEYDGNAYYFESTNQLKIALKNESEEGGVDATIISHNAGSSAYVGSRKASTDDGTLEVTIPNDDEQGKNIEIKYGTKSEVEAVASYDWYEKDKNATNFEIKSASELLGFAELVNSGNNFAGKTISLANDIDLSKACGDGIGNWTPIGTSSSKFKGAFDGQNHKIKNLYIVPETGTLQLQGLFAYIDGAEIKNLTVSGEMKNCMASAGIVANAANPKIENCANGIEINVNSGQPTLCGGIVRTATGTGYIKDCRNEGKLSGLMSCGGIVGSANANVYIENCQNSGEINATSGTAGGIAGTYKYTGTEKGIYLCKNTANVTTTGPYAGGIVATFNGQNSTYNKIEKCENQGTVSAKTSAGGIVGYIGLNSTNLRVYLENSLNIGNVSVEDTAGSKGGLIGKLEISLKNKNHKAYADIYNSFSYVNGLKAIGSETNTNTATTNKVGTGIITYKHVYYLDAENAGELLAGDSTQAPLSAEVFNASGIVKKLNEDGNNFWGWNPSDEKHLYPVFNGFEDYPVHEVRFEPFSGEDAENYTISLTAGFVNKELTQESKTKGSYLDFAGTFDGKATIAKNASSESTEIAEPMAILICNGDVTKYESASDIQLSDITGDAKIYYGSPVNYDNFVYTNWYSDGKTSFVIETAGQLKSVATLVNDGASFDGKTLTLASDIDLLGVCGEEKESWTPIGTESNPFKGTFDGKGKTISNLYINNESSSDPQGLFGYTCDATVKNFKISGEVKNNSSGNTGGVIGTASGAPAKSENTSGGQIVIKDITAEVNVEGKGTYTGGIVGYINAKQGSGKAGGATVIASNLTNSGTCTYNGTSESAYAGGIAGALEYGDTNGEGYFSQSCNSGNVTSSKGVAGGIIGRWASALVYKDKVTKIEDVYNTGSVNANKAGGVIGTIVTQATAGGTGTKASLSLKRAMNYGNISGTENACGVAGKPDASKGTCTVENVYYLDSTIKKPSETELGTSVTLDELKTGEIAFALDNGVSTSRRSTWGQSLANNRPEFYDASSAPLVYKLSLEATSGSLIKDEMSTLNILGTTATDGIMTYYFTAAFGQSPSVIWNAEGQEAEYVLDTFHLYNQNGTEIAATIDEENNKVTVSIPLATNLDAKAKFVKVPNLGESMKLVLHGNYGTSGEDGQKKIDTTVGKRYNSIAALSTSSGFRYGKYEFTGWYLDADCTQAVDMSSRMVPADQEPLQIELYAGWDTTSPYYQVTLDSNEGTISDEIAGEDGNVLIDIKGGNALDLTLYTSANIVREGYTFAGWYFDVEMHLPYSGEAVNDNITLYAGWKADESTQNLIDFDANEGYFTVDGHQIKHYYAYADENASVTLESLAVPTATRDMVGGYGYIFSGWFTSQTPVAPEEAWTGSDDVTEDITLYANWSQKTFDEYISDQKNQGSAGGETGGESGETGSVSIVIKDAETLKAFRDYVASGRSTANDTFSLGADITLDSSWSNGINGFEGTFDGGGYTITYDNASGALFNTVKGTVKNVNVAGTASVSGGIADTLIGGKIENCTVKSGSSFTGADVAGGIVGTISTDGGNVSGGSIFDCTIEDNVEISGGSYVGGIAGRVIGSDDKGSASIDDCKVGAATINGAGCSGNPAEGSGVGGLGGILGYGAGNINNCMVDATMQATKVGAYGIGGIVGVKGSTQGSMSIEKCGFTGSIKANGADSVGGILGSNMSQNSSKSAELKDVYVSGEMQLGERGNNVGGIMGSSVGDGSSSFIDIENAYWKGTIDVAAAPFDTIAGNSCATVTNAYYSNADGYESSQSGAIGKSNSTFISGEIAYELDKNHSPRGVWTQGEDGPVFNTSGDAGIIHKVSVDKTQEITWSDGTTATITTTVSSELNEKAGITDSDTAFVRNNEKVTTTVVGVPGSKVVKNSDGSTTTTKYNVQIKDKNGEQVLFDSENPTAEVRINKDLAANGTGGSNSVTVAGSGWGTGGGNTGGDGTGDQQGTGDGQGDGDGTGGQQGDGTGTHGEHGDNPSGGNDTGKDVIPAVIPSKTDMTVVPKTKNETQEVSEKPAASEASNPLEDSNHDANNEPQSGGQSQGGGEQGTIQPESKIYKLIKSVANTVKENPVTSAVIAIAVFAIIAFGAWNRKRKEDRR